MSNTGYTTININGQTIGLKFGMPSIKMIGEKWQDLKFAGNDNYTTAGIAYMLYAAYDNNCMVKEVPLTLTFEDFCDHVDENSLNETAFAPIQAAVKMFEESKFVKGLQVAQEDAKKKLIGTQLKDSATAS